MNQELAAHYGIGESSDEMRKVSLRNTQRSGLPHGGVLAVTSFPGRVSPVMRGNWISRSCGHATPTSSTQCQ